MDEFFTVKAESRSDLYEAVWWTPKDSTSMVALGNLTDTATSAIVKFGDDLTQKVSLAPHATEIIRHAAKAFDTAESVTISVTGASGSIVPTGIIASKDGSFNSVVRFYTPRLTKQPHLFANGFRVANVTPHMVLRNTTSESITAQPRFITLGGIENGEPVLTPQIVLGPNETKEVDLTQLSIAAKRRTDLDTVSVEVANSGAPGSLIGSLYGINKRTRVS